MIRPHSTQIYGRAGTYVNVTIMFLSAELVERQNTDPRAFVKELSLPLRRLIEQFRLPVTSSETESPANVNEIPNISQRRLIIPGEINVPKVP